MQALFKLDCCRLQKISEGSINLAECYANALNGPRKVGSGRTRDEDVPLSCSVGQIYERFAGELAEVDRLFFDDK